MKIFIIKLLLYLAPLLLLLGIYAYHDPFKVLYHYDHYTHTVDSSYFDVPGDFLATQTLLQQHDKYGYDAYIFGNSRAGNYLVHDWQPYLSGGLAYHFNVNYESLYGIEKKMQLIKRKDYELKNALIIIDQDLLAIVTNGNGHLRIKHPALSGGSWLSFQFECLGDYFDKDFLPAYLDLTCRGYNNLSSGHRKLFPKFVIQYDTITNETTMPKREAELVKDSAAIFTSQNNSFYKRDTTIQHYSPAVIGARQVALLQSIKNILDEKHTNYKVVISPLYDQVRLNTSDIALLYRIMGRDHVYDFSGINTITQNISNYYETSHYRPRVGKMILDSIYKK